MIPQKPNRTVLTVSDKKITLKLSKRLQDQIHIAHSQVGAVEWSGYVLFKEIINSLKDEECTLYADYLHILDIGTAAYTEFTVDEKIVDLYEQFPEAMDYSIGAIHTH